MWKETPHSCSVTPVVRKFENGFESPSSGASLNLFELGGGGGGRKVTFCRVVKRFLQIMST